MVIQNMKYKNVMMMTEHTFTPCIKYKNYTINVTREFVEDLKAGGYNIGSIIDKIIDDFLHKQIKTIRSEKLNKILND